MNINGISVRFSGDVHLPRCQRRWWEAHSFGSHEEEEKNDWRHREEEQDEGVEEGEVQWSWWRRRENKLDLHTHSRSRVA